MNSKTNNPTVLEVRRCDDPNCPKCLTARQDARIAELEAALADICANYDRKGNTPESRRVQAARALLNKEGR